MAKQTRVLSVVLMVVMAGCSGGTRPAFDDTVVGADSDPIVTPTSDLDAAEPEDETEGAVAGDDEQAVEVGSATPTTSSETDDLAPEADDLDDDQAATPVPVAGPTGFSRQGTVEVTLADGRSYGATIGCDYTTAADAWEFSFGGRSVDGVQIEGAYDNSQPDFAILFIAGSDSLNGDDVLLSNVNGGDDLLRTSTGGNQWTATFTLWTAAPDNQPVNAELVAVCG